MRVVTSFGKSFQTARKAAVVGFVAVVLSLVASGRAEAAVPAGTDEVQEDWVLIIASTSPDETAPQIVTIISPTETIDADYGVLELNHTTQPDYVDGGVQLQRWNGSDICDYSHSSNHDKLSTADETIKFTMVVKIQGGQLEFGVLNGTSTTWGDFGGNPDQWRSKTDTVLTDLSHYDRQVSTDHSRVAFAPNLVRSFVQKEVRYYKNGELLQTDTTQVPVYQAASAE